jgi:hypothetical protein
MGAAISSKLIIRNKNMKLGHFYKILYTSLILILGFFSISPVLAVPKEVILIRHADKLNQPKPGPFLSPKGEVRAIAFAYYYLNKFAEPDYIIATNPATSGQGGASVREIQTVAPLANILAERHPQIGFKVSHDYQETDNKQLINDLLHSEKYKGKIILICWHHSKISELLTGLGVTNANKIPKTNSFDTVYVVEYDTNGNITQFNQLQRQYDVSFNGSWQEFYKKLM